MAVSIQHMKPCHRSLSGQAAGGQQVFLFGDIHPFDSIGSTKASVVPDLTPAEGTFAVEENYRHCRRDRPEAFWCRIFRMRRLHLGLRVSIESA
jgi:hypothetical protein